MELGPYEVIGEIHGAPASNPLVMVVRRPSWVPLTKAQISYRRGTEVVTDEGLTLIINRTLARSLRAVDEDAERLMFDAHDALPRVSRPVEHRAQRRLAAIRHDNKPMPTKRSQPLHA